MAIKVSKTAPQAAASHATAPQTQAAESTAPKVTKTVDVAALNQTSGIDLTKLTPAQLAALQKQLKATKSEAKGDKTERFKIIDTMLAEKDEKGEFKHTTRDIMNALIKDNLLKVNGSDDEKNEIKKIQARKQFLEKKTDEKGKLVYAEGTFGYKASAQGFTLSASKVAEWFTPEHVAQLTPEHKKLIAASLK